MPYKSQAQSRFIHWKANQGVAWAKKFVSLPQQVKQHLTPTGKLRHA